MSNVVRFPDASQRVAERGEDTPRRPQLEDGFTRINNEILEAVAISPMTDRERRVVLIVIRLTYGWNRKAARATAGLLAELTGIHKDTVAKVLSGLIGKGVIKRHGGSRSPVSLNKNLDEWDLSAPERVVPEPKSKRPDSGQNDLSDSGQNDLPSKDRKDMNTPPYGGESTAGADDENPQPADEPRTSPQGEGSKPKGKALPNCPHQAILDQWAEVMPEKRQPLRSLWAKGTGGSRDLAARWKQGFGIINDHTGEPLYIDEATGVDWWGRFFRFLRRSEFLMRDDSRFFGLDWVCKADNFRKIMELKYHQDLAQGDGGEA